MQGRWVSMCWSVTTVNSTPANTTPVGEDSDNRIAHCCTQNGRIERGSRSKLSSHSEVTNTVWKDEVCPRQRRASFSYSFKVQMRGMERHSTQVSAWERQYTWCHPRQTWRRGPTQCSCADCHWNDGLWSAGSLVADCHPHRTLIIERSGDRWWCHDKVVRAQQHNVSCADCPSRWKDAVSGQGSCSVRRHWSWTLRYSSIHSHLVLPGPIFCVAVLWCLFRWIKGWDVSTVSSDCGGTSRVWSLIYRAIGDRMMTCASLLWVPTRRERPSCHWGLADDSLRDLRRLGFGQDDSDTSCWRNGGSVEGKGPTPCWHIFNTFVFCQDICVRRSTHLISWKGTAAELLACVMYGSVISMTMTRKQLQESCGHDGRRSGQTWQ